MVTCMGDGSILHVSRENNIYSVFVLQGLSHKQSHFVRIPRLSAPILNKGNAQQYMHGMNLVAAA